MYATLHWGKKGSTDTVFAAVYNFINDGNQW